ncbi:hypothetical protein OHB12_31090 [Nocardia sp. NBC_01730]|uniref:hypothetical protein n=1 Tax=Nocardia sp. NBC_01730 TaxID=2975998 RepID=UPI002E1396FC|nr:hypothetical protein OHB12_31090 [Nocardia sp. NBC_01730]
MTPPDREHPSQGAAQSNPFDTGLPMLRTPAGKGSKRRRPPGRRRPVRRREPELDLPPPELDLPEPSPPDKASARPRFGEWEEWLEPAAPSEELPDPPVEQNRHMPALDDEPPKAEDNAVQVPTIVNRSGIHPGTPVRRPRRTDQQRNNRPLAVLIVLGVVVAAVSIALTILYGSGSNSRTTAASSPARASGSTQITSATTTWARPPWAIATPGCEQRRTADIISGTDPGGTGNGPDAILAFEYAYYAERSGYRARAVVAPDAAVAPAEQIQRGINQVPAGTRYCVLITRAGDGADGQARWEVRLTQQFPDEQPSTFTQIVTTRTGSSQTLITGIAPG